MSMRSVDAELNAGEELGSAHCSSRLACVCGRLPFSQLCTGQEETRECFPFLRRHLEHKDLTTEPFLQGRLSGQGRIRMFPAWKTLSQGRDLLSTGCITDERSMSFRIMQSVHFTPFLQNRLCRGFGFTATLLSLSTSPRTRDKQPTFCTLLKSQSTFQCLFQHSALQTHSSGKVLH